MHFTMKNQAQLGCALPQDLRYYILRGDNVMVPMVPADQLPFRLPGVPRKLSHQQMSSECWKYLSEPPKGPYEYSPEPPSISTVFSKSQFCAPDHQVRSAQTVVDEPIVRPSRWSQSPAIAVDTTLTDRTTYASTPQKGLSMTDKFAEIYPLDAQRLGYHPPYPSGIEPDSSKKEFCTHWIKTGECAFTAIGCKYKHEMPEIAKLRELGFRETPRWWKEKTAIAARGPTWIEQRRAAQGQHKDIDLSEMPARREFDPSAFKKRVDTDRDVSSEDLRQRRSLLRREVNQERSDHSSRAPAMKPVVQSTTPAELLIDLDDSPVSRTSPRFSSVSSASPASEGSISSGFSTASSSNSATMVKTPTNTDRKRSRISRKEICVPRVPSPRRRSQVSWISGSSDGESPKPTRERERPTYPSFTHAAESAKQSGLHRSKYSATSDETAKPKKAIYKVLQPQNAVNTAAKVHHATARGNEKAKKAPNHIRERLRGSVTKATTATGRKAIA